MQMPFVYYQSQMDAEILASGKDYAELRKTIVIFICPFDPIGCGWHLYWYENTCRRDTTLCLQDGAVKVILNTRGTGEGIPPQLQAFMDYVNSGILSSNPLVQAIDRRVNEVKQSQAERMSYMTYELALRDARKDGEAEGEARGRAEGKAEGKALMIRVWHMLQKKVSFPEIALQTDLSLQEVQEIAQEYGISY